MRTANVRLGSARLLFLVLAGGALVLAGCDSGGGETVTDTGGGTDPGADASGDTGGTGGDGDAAMTSDGQDAETGPAVASLEADLCKPLASSLCTRASKCGCAKATGGPGFDRAACNEAYIASCLERYAAEEAGLASGELVLSPELTAQCVQAMLDGTGRCEKPSDLVWSARCLHIVSGTEPVGSACTHEYCASGAGRCSEGFCEALPNEGQSCLLACGDESYCVNGLCVRQTTAGRSCTLDGECEQPLRCVEGLCTALAESGQDCDYDQQCEVGLSCAIDGCSPLAETCTGSFECGHRGLCITDVARECVSVGIAGSPCTDSSQCGAALYCDKTSSECTARPGEGDACGNGYECAEGLACQLGSGVCGAIPGEGEACGMGPVVPIVCADGLGCINNSCAPLPGQGEDCATGYQCAPPLGCDVTVGPGKCSPRRPAGGYCSGDYICSDGTFCDYNELECVAFRAEGEPCGSGVECGPDQACLPDAIGIFRCAPIPWLGDPCYAECASGAYCLETKGDSRCVPEICGAVGY